MRHREHALHGRIGERFACLPHGLHGKITGISGIGVSEHPPDGVEQPGEGLVEQYRDGLRGEEPNVIPLCVDLIGELLETLKELGRGQRDVPGMHGVLIDQRPHRGGDAQRRHRLLHGIHGVAPAEQLVAKPIDDATEHLLRRCTAVQDGACILVMHKVEFARIPGRGRGGEFAENGEEDTEQRRFTAEHAERPAPAFRIDVFLEQQAEFPGMGGTGVGKELGRKECHGRLDAGLFAAPTTQFRKCHHSAAHPLECGLLQFRIPRRPYTEDVDHTAERTRAGGQRIVELVTFRLQPFGQSDDVIQLIQFRLRGIDSLGDVLAERIVVAIADGQVKYSCVAHM